MTCPTCHGPVLLDKNTGDYICWPCQKAVASTVLPDGARMAAQPAQVPQQAKRHKYGVSPAEERTVDSIVFASKKEAECYSDLRVMQGCGVIAGLSLQPKFPRTGKGGKVIEHYIGDFLYYLVCEREWVVSDAKGHRTRDYIRKRKWMKEELGIIIREV